MKSFIFFFQQTLNIEENTFEFDKSDLETLFLHLNQRELLDVYHEFCQRIDDQSISTLIHKLIRYYTSGMAQLIQIRFRTGKVYLPQSVTVHVSTELYQQLFKAMNNYAQYLPIFQQIVNDHSIFDC